MLSNEASERELYWQQRLGYGTDTTITYAQTLRASTPAATAKFKETIKNSELWKKATDKRIEYFRSPANKNKSEECRAKMKEAWERRKARPYVKRKNKPCLPYERKNKKAILQFDLQGNFIKEWPSTSEARKFFPNGGTAITTCLRQVTKKAYGFIWKYKNVSPAIASTDIA